MTGTGFHLVKHSVDGDDSCAAKWVSLIPLDWTLKNGSNGKSDDFKN